MAESKFLKWQDKNGDGIIDACEDQALIRDEGPCPECKPNPSYFPPNWKNRTQTEPWNNEKIAEYQITVVTSETSLGSDEDIERMFEKYEEEAIVNLLLGFGKADSQNIRDSLKRHVEYKKYYLPDNPNSFVLLLYSVPCDYFYRIPGMNDDEADIDEDEQEASASGDIKVTYDASQITIMLMKFRKAMHLYSRYYKVHQALENGVLIEQAGSNKGKVFSSSTMGKYGDNGFGNSRVKEVLTELDSWLNTQDINIHGVGRPSFGKDRAERIRFVFSSEYSIKRIKVWTVECKEKPIVFGKKRLKLLKSKPGWNDPRACAYFSRLYDIETDLTAREPSPWIDFVQKYTYPPVAAYKDYGLNTDGSGASCVGKALRAEAKQLGQDVLDEVFSLGDAVAYAFNKSVCYPDLNKVEIMREKLGIADPDANATSTGVKLNPITRKNIYALATEQANQQLKNADPLTQFCLQIASSDNPSYDIGDLWANGMDRVKLCGLSAAMTEVIKCLMNGMSLEKALSAIVKSALEGMSISNFEALFVGLPPEKQQELNVLIKQKLSNGEFFQPDTSGQQLSDTIDGNLPFEHPWVGVPADEAANLTLKDLWKGSKAGKKIQLEENETQVGERRTLASRLETQQGAKGKLNKNAVFQAYILALLEVYSEELLLLIDELNKFPGVQLIAKTIALLDCPRAPLYEPNFLDFIGSVQLPFCKNTDPIALKYPVRNPFEWVPNKADWSKITFDTVRIAIQRILFQTKMKLMVRICTLIGSAICNALGTVGSLVASLPDPGKKNAGAIAELIRESICGPGASDEKVNDTIVDMFAKFGVGGAAFANEEDVLALMGDISIATTRAELTNAFLGNVSQEFANVTHNLIQHSYPQFSPGLPNAAAISDMFKDAGTLLPADTRRTMQDFLNNLPEDDFAPANPTLCATEEQLQEFCERRAALLDGRATSEQAAQMCEDLQDELAEALEDLLDDPGEILDNAIPPLVSDPGCDNGIVPFETPEAQETAANALGSAMEQLKIDFMEDMVGNGPLQRKYGLINLLLSDTNGQPLTAHWRKSANRPWYVDFVTERTLEDILEAMGDAAEDQSAGALIAALSPAVTPLQEGALPMTLAYWLQQQMKEFSEYSSIPGDMKINFALTNDYVGDIKGQPISYKQLGIDQMFGTDPDVTGISDFGYNIEYIPDEEKEEMTIVKKGRKKTPDITLTFKDNNKGRRYTPSPDNVDNEDMEQGENFSDMIKETGFQYGFDVEMYLADLQNNSNYGSATRPLDATRIKINELFNLAQSEIDKETYELMTEEEKEEYDQERKEAEQSGTESVQESELFEFMAIDDTFDNIELISQYPNFLNCFRNKVEYSPQAFLLKDIISSNNQNSVSISEASSFINDMSSVAISKLREDIANNDQAFLYGAKYDELTIDMYDYVVEAGQTDSPAGTLYSEATIDGKRITNRDAILGVSRDQLINKEKARVYYLNPSTYGGKYVNPPLYVKPMKQEGWIGMVDVLLPEFTPCKPRTADLVDFQEIQDEVSRIYNDIPEDERLKSDQDCIVEMPFNRVLERNAKAGIQGVIKAACKIYASTHFIKSLATFTTFYPNFTENYSSIYAQYVVEDMEASFKSAQGAIWEAFNPFKDTEFWYAFLEQAVQTYARLVDDGHIVDPPDSVLQLLFQLNDSQEEFEYVFKDDKKKARKNNEISRFRTLKDYRKELNLEHVQQYEEQAKLVLKEFVIMELNNMGKTFIDNIKSAGFEPKYSDLTSYFLKKLTQGADSLNIDEEIKETIVGLPTEGEDHFTPGNEFALPDGTEYIGYYHVHQDEDGNEQYMAGAFHSESSEQLVLTVFGTKVSVSIGDIKDYGFTPSSNEKKFVIEKYTSIDGQKMKPSTAYNTINSNDGELNVSDVYPGTMELVYAVGEDQGRAVGVTGELGVRHGLQFSALIGGRKKVLTTVEIDALDVKISAYRPLSANSKQLLCLINHLKDDEVFKMCKNYIVPMNKSLALLAIYNDMGLLSSVGEWTVREDSTLLRLSNIRRKNRPTFVTKPGTKVELIDGKAVYTASVPGWASLESRERFTPFVTTWDDWDKVLLRNSKSRIKKMFKVYYESREFNSSRDNNQFKPGKIIASRMREALRRPSAARLPWWKRRMMRPNVFNANGEICKKKD
jgi:hypothetical protein